MAVSATRISLTTRPEDLFRDTAPVLHLARSALELSIRGKSRCMRRWSFRNRNIMQLTIEKMIGEFERGAITRRQLALSITALLTAARSASAEPDMQAVTLNHVTVRVADVQRTSKFYQDVFGMPLKQHSEKTHILGVGKSFFGIEQKPGGPALDHFDFGIAGCDADAVLAKLKERDLKVEPGGNKDSFKFSDTDGFLVQL